MKKIIAVLLFSFMVLNLVACGNSGDKTGQPSVEGNSADKTGQPSAEGNFADKTGQLSTGENSGKNDLGDDKSEENKNSDNMESGGESETQTDETENSGLQEIKVLVAYFSATNTTKGVAEHIANGLGADIYEIIPEEPYTNADLNYNDDSSRTTIEMNDPDARPVISGSVENMEQYTIVFIGYPIWWGEAPRIVSTFVESYDFSGKTIVPFCTSGSSGIGASATKLEQLTSGAQWLDGKRLKGSDSQDTVMEWVNGLGLDFGN